MSTRNSRGQTRRRTRPTIDARAEDELELDDYGDDDDEGLSDEVTPISRAERRREQRRKERLRRRKKVVIEDTPPEQMVITLIGVDYEITVPDMGLLLDLADAASGSMSPKDQLIEWVDAAFNEEDADEVIDRLERKEVKWSKLQELMQRVTAEAGKNPTG